MIQIQLPDEISTILSDIKNDREKNLEPTSNRQIVIDALKEYHKNRVLEVSNQSASL